MNYQELRDSYPKWAHKLFDDDDGFKRLESDYGYFIRTEGLPDEYREIRNWCNEFIGEEDQKWKYLGGRTADNSKPCGTWCFTNEQDLIAFKLRWLNA